MGFFGLEAVPVALENRLDLMNRLAGVMDARRQVEIAADALESDLNLVARGELRTTPLLSNNKSFDFRARDSEFLVGVSLDTPLDRRAERNNYRATQIAYQQARRGYMATEDRIKLEVRQELRTLDELSQNLVLRRRRVQFSARELDIAETLANPGQRGLSITTALRSLNRAQDELIEVWLDYEGTRLNLSRDLGTMQVDDRGFWIDPFYQRMLESNDGLTDEAG